MARRVFFSFHYERDAWRASQVRNSGITKDIVGFVDAADWEKIERTGEDAVKGWITSQLEGTSVTVVLVGAETNKRRWVIYELEQSWKRRNGILGVYIHNIKDSNQRTDIKGDATFGDIFTSDLDNKRFFGERFALYDWVTDHGRDNIDNWIEQAAKAAGK